MLGFNLIFLVNHRHFFPFVYYKASMLLSIFSKNYSRKKKKGYNNLYGFWFFLIFSAAEFTNTKKKIVSSVTQKESALFLLFASHNMEDVNG